MTQKEKIIDKLKDTILNFESSTEIVNYAIIFEKRIALSNSATDLTQESVANYIELLNVKKLEEKSQKGLLETVLLEFEEESLYYIRCTPKIRIVAVVRKDYPGDAEKKLREFAEQIKNAFEPSSKRPEEARTKQLEPELIKLTLEPLPKSPSEEGPKEEEPKIEEMFATIDTMVDEFQVPEFETFKKLVKFAIPFKKKK